MLGLIPTAHKVTLEPIETEGLKKNMGLGAILFLLLVLVCLTLFIVFIVKTARMWGALHIVLLSILFVECWVFLYFTAGVQHERVRATKEAFQQTKRAKEVVAASWKLRYGSVDAPVDSLEAVLPVQGRLERLTIDRGRVWRELAFVDVQGDIVRLNVRPAVPLPSADDLGAEPVAPAKAVVEESLPENLVVYGFQEQRDIEGNPLPVFYLGEYRVLKNDMTAGEVSLQPTAPLHSVQKSRMAQGTDTWTLYELLPIDSHSAFSAEGSEPSDEAMFGRPDEEKIRELLSEVPDSIISSYLGDGQRASDDDRPESIWEQINLLKDHKIDVDSDLTADATISGYFDQSGRSVDNRLKRAEQVELLASEVKDNRIVVIESEARRLISEGVAERVQRVFVRPLNDYLGLFNSKASADFELKERIAYYQHQNQLMDGANQTHEKMLATRQQEKQGLSSDLKNYQREIKILEEAVQQATGDLASLKQELSDLYRQIQLRHQQMTSTGT